MPNNNSESKQEVSAWRNRERKRGIITEDDRTFLAQSRPLRTSETPDKQTIRDKRYRIRERAKNAILDFNYLVNINSEDRQKIFDFLIDEGGPTLGSIFEFLYLGITELGENAEEDLDLEGFVQVLERAIIESERRERNYIAHVGVNINIERTRPNPETVLDKMLEGKGSIEEFMYYIDNEGDTSDLFESVADQGEPLMVSAGSDDNRVELISVEEARERLEAETEVLGDEDDQS
jgi:hypothetical protein